MEPLYQYWSDILREGPYKGRKIQDLVGPILDPWYVWDLYKEGKFCYRAENLNTRLLRYIASDIDMALRRDPRAGDRSKSTLPLCINSNPDTYFLETE